MKMRFAVAALAVLLAASCKPAGDDAAKPAAAPVAAIKPPAGQDWVSTVVVTPEGGYRMGNPAAPIKLVEYGSRTCPVCGAFGRDAFEPLKAKYISTGKVSFEFREYLVHGQPDFPAALLGRCGGTEPFFPLLEEMYKQQGPIEEKLGSADAQALFQRMQSASPTQAAAEWGQYLGYLDFVKQRGIPEPKARACLADGKDLNAIFKIMEAGDKLGVRGTPSFFINGTKSESISWGQLEPELKRAGG